MCILSIVIAWIIYVVILEFGLLYSLSFWGYKYCHSMAFFLFVILGHYFSCHPVCGGAVLTISLCHPGCGVPTKIFVFVGCCLDPRIQVYKVVAKTTLIFIQFGIC